MAHRLWIALALAAGFGCGANAKFAGLKMEPRKAALKERIVTRQLSNGLKVVLLPDSRTNLVTVGVHYDVGGVDDPPDDLGLAHYVEHVLFDAAFRGAVGQQLRQVAINENAMTMFDRTYFYAAALDVDLDRVLETAARRFEVGCADLDDAVLARERDVVIEEAKYRSQPTTEALMTALWEARHPYAHGPGGTTFADVSRERVCKFIETHYGPASAVLVVTGNVRDADLDKIRARFEPIARRPTAPHIEAPAIARGVERVTVPGLTKPAVMFAFAVPGEGSDADAAVEMATRLAWPVLGTRTATVGVIGGRDARALLVIAEVDDAGQLDALEQALREVLAQPQLRDLEERQGALRLNAVTELDDILGAGFALAGQAARGQPLTRFRMLRQLDRLNVHQIKRWLDLSRSRVVQLVPEAGGARDRGADSLATSLHQLDVPRSPIPDIGALVPRRLFATVQDYKLANGMRVLLAPDDESVAIDARLVIAGATGGGDGAAEEQLASQAALRLTARSDGPEAMKRMRWYAQIRAPYFPIVTDKATVFQVSGVSLYADWHLWSLAWRVLHGGYPECEPGHRGCDKVSPKPATQPLAISLVARRLAGRPDAKPSVSQFSRARLEAYRRAAYRPEVATLIVAGNFDVAAMRKEVETLFGGWRSGGRPRVATTNAPKLPVTSSYIAIPDADAKTVELAIGFAQQAAPSSSERFAQEIMFEILNERLRVTREGLGVSYGVYAFALDKGLVVTGNVEPAYATEAAKSIAAAIASVRNGGVELADDFARARARVLMRVLAVPLGAGRRARALERIALDAAPTSELDRDSELVRALELSDVARIAARDLDADHMIVAARGTDANARAALEALGAKTIETLSPTVTPKNSPTTPHEQLLVTRP